MRYDRWQFNNFDVRLNDIDDKIENLPESKTSFVRFTKSLLNLSVIDKKIIELANFSAIKGELYFFDIFVYISSSFSQSILPSLIVNGREFVGVEQKIDRDTKTIQITGTFVADKSKNIKVEISLSPSDLKEVIVSEVKMNVFGKDVGEEAKCYHSVFCHDGLLVSKNINGQVLQQIISENEQKISEENFKLLSNGISHDFAVLFAGTAQEKIFFFRVSEDGKLFVSDLNDRLETFICGDISKVSVATDGKIIAVCMLNNNTCFFCEFDGENITNLIELNFKRKNLKDLLCYYSKNLDCFCLALTDRQNSNYLLFSTDAKNLALATLMAEIDIEVTTYK